jgi:hypothetical protein
MKKLEQKAEAAANIYVQTALEKTESQEDCWSAKEDYIAGYCLGNVSANLHVSQKINKALRNLAEMVRVAEGRGDYHTSTMARFVMEVLK